MAPVKVPLEIRDPIHGPIQVSDEEKKVIDSPFIQRLRSIKQTGFAELAFPGATHNRYTHSLGAFHLAGQVFNLVFKEFPWASDAERNKFRSILRMAALLHDVGHGPLSHAIEAAMPDKKDVVGGEGQATHEDYTEAIILRSSLNRVLSEVFGSELPLAVVSLVRGENRKPEYFRAGQDSLNLFPIMSSLISGELDVDRMDYMVRDSLYCGAPYGQFDRDWIFSNLIYHVADDQVYLAMDSRAIYAFEDFLLSRYHMYLIVYLHHKSVVYDEMLYQFLMAEKNHTKVPSNLEEYLQVDDYWLRTKLKESSNPWAKRIIEQRPYRMLLEVKSDQTDEAKTYADELEKKLKSEGVHYFRSSSSGLLSKYGHKEKTTGFPIYVVYRDPRFTSGFKPGTRFEKLSDATELYSKYKKQRIIDRIYAES